MTDILVISGLNREAALVAEPGIVTIAGGGDRATLERHLAGLGERPFAAVISFGLAGSLVVELTPGELVLPTGVRDGDRTYPVDPTILDRWLSRLADPARPVSTGDLVGSDVPLLTAASKREAARGGAVAVDMESHAAAAYAARHGIPFAVLRAISDPADSDLPPLAGTAMRPDGSVDIMGVVAGLARDPRQLPALLRTGRDANAAFRTLRRVRGLLGPLFGLLSLDLR